MAGDVYNEYIVELNRFLNGNSSIDDIERLLPDIERYRGQEELSDARKVALDARIRDARAKLLTDKKNRNEHKDVA